MHPLVSVIIPLYNGERYIIDCLESLRKQKYRNLEIIVIDDGSTDHSLDKINKYYVRYEKNLLINIIKQKNQGQGASRNTGIDNVHGKYMMFIDQDDTLVTGILKKMVAKAEKLNSDIIAAGYQRVSPNGKIKIEVILQNTEWSKFKIVAPWSKLYRTEFVLKNKVRFLPVVLGEDVYFLMQLYSFEPKVDFLEEIGYNWLDNIESVSNTTYKRLGGETSLLPLYNMLERLKNKEKLKKDRMYEYFLIKTAVWNILYTLRKNNYAVVLENSIRIWSWFNSHFSDYMRNPYIKITKPKGESLKIRFVIWGYMTIKKIGCEQLVLRIFSK